jgi:DNA polymerase-3 subunit gamma/tau
MSQALYRKWRPQTWDQVVGQDHVIQTLRNAVGGGRVAHAYLFAGPRGTGKTTTARLLAKAVNCLDPDLSQRPCDHCEHCRAIREGRFLDLIEIDAASNTSVEDVRDLRDRISFAPNQGAFKVYIIDEVHMLSTAAFNALLKTLEEPPEHAIFVLATTEVHKIPATVLSRCQRHEFRRLPVAVISNQLRLLAGREKLPVEDAALDMIARQATGSLRDGISLLDQLASSGGVVSLDLTQQVLGTVGGEAVRGVVAALVDGDRAAGLAQIDQALDAGADPRQFGRQVVDYLRGLLLVKMGNAALVDAVPEMRQVMAAQAEQLSLRALLAAIRAFNRAALESRISWQPGLPLEMAFVEASYAPAAEPGEAALPAADESRQAYRAGSSAPPPESKAQPALPPPAPPARPAPEAPLPSAGTLTFQELQQRWREVLAAARAYDARTQALLNSGRPLGVMDGALVLGFRSDLLREKMEKGHNLSVAAKALQEVFGQAIAVRCGLIGKSEPAVETGEAPLPPLEDGGMVATAVHELGGQVVDVKPAPPDGAA